MAMKQSILLTSMDDFITCEEHICIWEYYPASYTEPEELSLISVDGMGKEVCAKDLWKAAESEYPEKLTDLEYDG